MDENASRAIFIGVSVFVAIITITLVTTLYNVAKESAAEANRYDMTLASNTYLQNLLDKEEIKGSELRYIINYYFGSTKVGIHIKNQTLYQENKNLGEEALTLQNDYINEYNSKDDHSDWYNNSFEKNLDYNIRAHYTYGLLVYKTKIGFNIVAIYLR